MKEQLYRHYESNYLYKITDESIDTDSGEPRITYKNVNHQNARNLNCTKSYFFEVFENGVSRFAPIFPEKEIANQKLFNSVHDAVVKDIEDLMAKVDVLAAPLEDESLYTEEMATAIHLKRLVGTTTSIKEDLLERRKKGIETYGKHLTPFNDRNALQDAYEEKLDELCYQKQDLMEKEQRRKIQESL
ncbi:hypothetical protein [Crocosphaera sp.]|uniref:hypothetical protein n=1 Tax=Crocosphaera sp. TaxID=2729996 RepID=UPI00261DA009|nr:hypothetical protein [Crocosphaera sp.]MDJ0579089.1 hypothetical protein [Crocosphaera sp.]